jgi:SAM-dependent methyltransferase
MSDDYLTLNRANWDSRAPLHAASPDYQLDRAVADPGWLSGVVRFDLPWLGDIAGLDVAHLQCHIGTDTLSLHRLGARVTGLDFSSASIAEARRLAERAGADIRFVVSDVYDAPEALGRERFDLVYTGIGVLSWLPRIRPWAAAVAGVLRPGGRLHLREQHPVLATMDWERQDGLLVARDPYFEHADRPLVDESDVSYVATDGPITAATTHIFNHGLGEIVTALLDEGLEVTALVEHDSIPWLALPAAMDWDAEAGEARLKRTPPELPLTYTLQARKGGAGA